MGINENRRAGVFDDALVEAVRKYAEKKGIKIKDMRAFSEKTVCVMDDSDEFDTYFRRDDYNIIHPEVWGKNLECLFPGELSEMDFGVLPSASSAQRVDSFSDAFLYAVYVLEPKTPQAEWYGQPHAME